MSIFFYPQQITQFSRSYHISNENDDDIGAVEGYLNEYGELVSVIKIYNSKFQKQGLGFLAFKKVFDELDSVIPIETIIGSWHKDGEFQDFEDGMSTNLRIFLKCIKNGNDYSSCAFDTPTGKWALKLGFKDCKVLSVSSDEVRVAFKKKRI